MSNDSFGNRVVVLKSSDLGLLQETNFSTWLVETMQSAQIDRCNAILVRLHGSAAALVENFQKTRKFSVRGWVEQQHPYEGYLELFCPLLHDNIPPYKTARIGVSIVVSTGDKVFVVKERYGPPLFKFVTGAVESGESPLQAAIRELREELGIEADANSFQLKAIHQEKQACVGVDDYCFVYHCACGEAVEASIQTQEILECKKVLVATSDADNSLTAYTKTLINLIFRNVPEPTPLIRGKKELIAFKFQ